MKKIAFAHDLPHTDRMLEDIVAFAGAQVLRLSLQSTKLPDSSEAVSIDPLRTFPQSLIERITRAGFPPMRVFGGTALVTTEPAATTEFSPTVTPPMMVAPAAIHTFFSRLCRQKEV